MATPKSSKPAEGPAFEQALARLETLVKEMEGGTLSLDRIAYFTGAEAQKACAEDGVTDTSNIAFYNALSADGVIRVHKQFKVSHNVFNFLTSKKFKLINER